MLCVTLKCLNSDFERDDLKILSPGEVLLQDKRRVDLSVQRRAVLATMRALLVETGVCGIDEAQKIKIQRMPSGQPYLKGPQGSPKLPLISISHSGPWVACCLSDLGKPIGIDIEDLNLERKFVEIASYAFFPEEIKGVKEGGEDVFYKLWGAKEAIAKCYGEGFSRALALNVSALLEGKPVKDANQTFFLHQQQYKEAVFLTVAQQGLDLDELRLV